jgi:long-chain fatty acid transport protein
MGYYVKPIDDHWSVGFGVYVPFGLITDYGSGDAARYWGKKSHVEVVTFQPTVSYAFNDKVSIGFGPTINRIKGELGSNLINPSTPGPTMASEDQGRRYRRRLQHRHPGASHRPYPRGPDLPLDGRLQARRQYPRQHAAGGPSRQVRRQLKIKTPESVDFSVTHELDDQWTLYAGSTWTRWSRLKDITVRTKRRQASRSDHHRRAELA